MDNAKSIPADLPILQKWMQSVITNVGGVEQGIQSDEARRLINIDAAEVESVVTRSEKRTSLERLEVYANAYYARLIECLKSIYPLFARSVGDELFDQFALAYLQQHPSTSYTLNRLGDQFPEFLEVTSPTYRTDEWSLEDFLVGLAVTERSIDQIFDGPGYEGQEVVSSKQLEGIEPEAFAEATFTMVPCLRIHSFPFPVNDFITAVKQDANAPIPAFQPSYLALTRREFVVRRVPLNRFEYFVLSGLAAGGTVNQAIHGALIEVGEPENLSQSLAAAFQKFAAEQFFFTIEL
ncbi:HvfC/BufC family peptide modification chaperone [Bremerella sp. T1]|uniref:HvfC/BufC N-terminal domain-containing protein n=1 Tax=Bremerella sp. TYQ1 TaxID=3119568 RepID=UPI001CCC90FD|nr:DNA-binding domain-containing protein [Bremerella volcania]UBM35097.1 DNA-binding domain-containing protein [Bremerella volcania]